MDTTTLTHSFTGPGGTLRWHLRGPSLDSQEWGSHTNYVLAFPSVEARDAYLAAVEAEPTFEDDHMLTSRVPVGRYALFGHAAVTVRDALHRVTEVTFDPWDLSVTEDGWFEGTTGGDTLLAEEDRLPGGAASRPGAFAEWLTAHGIPTEYAGGPSL